MYKKRFLTYVRLLHLGVRARQAHLSPKSLEASTSSSFEPWTLERARIRWFLTSEHAWLIYPTTKQPLPPEVCLEAAEPKALVYLEAQYGTDRCRARIGVALFCRTHVVLLWGREVRCWRAQGRARAFWLHRGYCEGLRIFACGEASIQLSKRSSSLRSIS